MTPDAFISESIAAGQDRGVAGLDADQRLVYLIAEAECLCDMEGVDSFLNCYSPEWIPETAAAFEAVGAVEIAAAMRSVPVDATAGDTLLNRLNELITRRAGYNYDAIRRVVEMRRNGRK